MVDRYDEPVHSVEVTYEVPSRLPHLLKSGAVDAILVSSIEALRSPNAIVAGSVGILSESAVESVRLFSKVPFDQIKVLALDSASMTSNCLAQILLRESYQLTPQVVTVDPDQATMLEGADACVLIGDNGMLATSEGYFVMDLGEAWFELTSLPFVWALWMLKNPDPNLIAVLEAPLVQSGFLNPHQNLDPAREGIGRLDVVMAPDRRRDLILKTAKRSGWPIERVEHYLQSSITYWIGYEAWEGLIRFGELLSKHKLLSHWMEPVRIFATKGDAAVSEEDQRLMKILRRGSEPTTS